MVSTVNYEQLPGYTSIINLNIEVIYMLYDLQFTILQWSKYESITLFSK